MMYFGYCNADTGLPQSLRGPLHYQVQISDIEIQWILTPFLETPESGEVYNFTMQLYHWFLHILELHDTAKEGDLNQTILNCKFSFSFKTQQISI